MADLYFYFLAVVGSFILILIFKKNFFKPSLNRLSPVDDVTVVIPFRNEADNLKILIESFKKQLKLPAKVIFVDDHSSDESIDIIKAYLKLNQNAHLIHLPDNLKGKKEALRFAIRNVKSKYCFTIDADIWFDEYFFEQVIINESTDMQIRPVLMKGNSLIGYFASQEHFFFNALNKLLAPIYILSSSGANLLFKKSAFDQLDDIDSHNHIASGDDHFLLRSFQAGHARIVVSDARNDLVFTASPNNLVDYLNQRIRWLGKMKLKTSMPELIIGSFIAIYLIGSFLTMIYLLLIGSLELFLVLIIVRWIIDSLVFLNYSIPLRQSAQWWWLPFFQVVYPILFIAVMLGSLFYKPKWKGRNI